MVFGWVTTVIGFLRNILRSPVQRKPECFVLSENYDHSGEPINRNILIREPLAYEQMAIDFDKNLLRTREDAYLERQLEHFTKLRSIEEKYPLWDENVLSHLSNVFAIFDTEGVGLIQREDFSSLLRNLGSEASSEIRILDFNKADTDGDGCINYEEFYDLLYNITSSKDAREKSLAQKTLEASTSANFLSSLKAPDQMEFGLS